MQNRAQSIESADSTVVRRQYRMVLDHWMSVFGCYAFGSSYEYYIVYVCVYNAVDLLYSRIISLNHRRGSHSIYPGTYPIYMDGPAVAGQTQQVSTHG